jgi:hypothetical protein
MLCSTPLTRHARPAWHADEGATGGERTAADAPFDYAALKAAYRNAAGGTGAWMVNNGFDKAHAESPLAQARDSGRLWPAVHRQPDRSSA